MSLRLPRGRGRARALLALAIVALAAAPPAFARDDSLSRTPPMGWNSWYAYGCHVTQDQILANAHALVQTGMAARGYRYVNVDGCWEAPTRDVDGQLRSDPQTFPDGMAALGRKIHALGLKFGLYTSAGETICLHQSPGSYGHYRQDFTTFASWKVDYVKVDWCSPAPGEQLGRSYAAVARAAAQSGRRMIVTVSTPGMKQPWRWGQSYGNSWRIAPDLDGTWKSLLAVVDVDAPLWPFARPGGWNDADILQAGNSLLTPDEERAQFGLWSILASPLLAGNRLPEMSAETRSTLTNREVISVSQDRLGRQGRRIRRRGGLEVWLRPLVKGCGAVLTLNRTGRAAVIRLDLRALAGLRPARRYSLRDLWRHTGGDHTARLELPTASHGVRMLRACPH